MDKSMAATLYTMCRLGQRAKWATKAHRSWKEQICPVRIANVSRRYVLIRSRSSTHIMNSCARRLRCLGDPPAAPVKSVRTSSRDSDRESRVRLLDSWSAIAAFTIKSTSELDL